MNKTIYKIYFTMENGEPAQQELPTLTQALKCAELHRRQGMRFVTMACENVDQVGKLGVDSVENGNTPDGVEYSWVKRRDGGQ